MRRKAQVWGWGVGEQLLSSVLARGAQKSRLLASHVHPVCTATVKLNEEEHRGDRLPSSGSQPRGTWQRLTKGARTTAAYVN